MRKAKTEKTLVVGYGDRAYAFISEFMRSIPLFADPVIRIPYKPKLHEVADITVMNPMPRAPIKHILDVLDPFNAREISKRFDVVFIATDDEVSIATARLLDAEVYYVDESLEPREIPDIEPPRGERIVRKINGLYVIPGYGRDIFDEIIRLEEGFITPTGCIVASSEEAARRILNERSL